MGAPQTYPQLVHTRHVDIERGKRSHGCVEVSAQEHIDVADLGLVYLNVSPEGAIREAARLSRMDT